MATDGQTSVIDKVVADKPYHSNQVLVRQRVPILRARGFEFDALCGGASTARYDRAGRPRATSTRIRPLTLYSTPRSVRVGSSLEARRAGT